MSLSGAARGLAVAALLALLAAAPSFGQAPAAGGKGAASGTEAAASGAAPGGAGTEAPAAHTPAPWKPEELPPLLNTLRRGEILFFGSLPFSFFYTFEVYDVYRFAASGFDPLQAPWPFRAAADIQYSDAEKGWLIASAVVVSLGVAVADFLVRESRESRRAGAGSDDAR